MTKGQAAPEVEHAYTQARALCQQVGETPELVPVLFGLWRFYMYGHSCTRRESSGNVAAPGAAGHDPALAVIAHYALGATWLWLGALPAARQHLEAGIARYSQTSAVRRCSAWAKIRGLAAAPMPPDPPVAGVPAQALARFHEALALAHELSHPYSLAFAGVGGLRLAVAPGRAGRARAGRGRCRALD